MRGHAVSRYAVSCTMMSRRRPRVSRRKAARRSTRDGWFHPVCDISWSNTRMRCLAGAKPPRVGEPLQRRSSTRGPGERIAVDEQAALIAEQPGAAVQADTATRGAAHEAAGAGATARRREDDAGL